LAWLWHGLTSNALRLRFLAITTQIPPGKDAWTHLGNSPRIKIRQNRAFNLKHSKDNLTSKQE
jgi:hypothetical protein